MYRVTLFAIVAAAVFCVVTAAPQIPDFPTQAPCGVNEATYPCGRRCEQKCNEEIPAFCKGLKCLGFTCRCQNGFARNVETDVCVPISECPAKN